VVSDLMENLKKQISLSLKEGMEKLEKEGFLKAPFPEKIPLSLSVNSQFGDLSTNVALQVKSGKSPIALANILAEGLRKITSVENVEVKEPGFINIFLKRQFFYRLLFSVLKQGDKFGLSRRRKREKVLLEFVSANPTGPLTIAHGRQAALGEAIANVLSANGYQVAKEYYLNDTGVQIDLLGESLLARYREVLTLPFSIPEDGYSGEYLKEMAKDLKEKYQDKLLAKGKDFFSNLATVRIISQIRKDLSDFRVNFDSWFSETKLRQSSSIKNVLAKLKEKGYLYQKGGAFWFKSSLFGDEKDRVLKKSDDTYTYFAPDIGYHQNKYERGYQRLIDLFGPDHDGYVPRLKAALVALGYPVNSLSVLIVQLTTLYQGKKKLQMSTRKGKFITLRELIQEVGADVAKYFFLSRKPQSHLDFDLELAKKNSLENPAYYIQYAYARAESIMKFAREKGISVKRRIKLPWFFLLSEKEEIAILHLLFRFPYLIEAEGKTLEVHPILKFLQELAGNFHSYYAKFRIISEDKDLTRARLLLVKGVRIVLKNGLKLLGISAPEKM